jgi:hypothetical protein
MALSIGLIGKGSRTPLTKRTFHEQNQEVSLIAPTPGLCPDFHSH